jgi:hypothetical protein
MPVIAPDWSSAGPTHPRPAAAAPSRRLRVVGAWLLAAAGVAGIALLVALTGGGRGPIAVSPILQSRGARQATLVVTQLDAPPVPVSAPRVEPTVIPVPARAHHSHHRRRQAAEPPAAEEVGGRTVREGRIVDPFAGDE